MGERPPKTEFKQLNAEPVIPKAFPQWEKIMNNWGNLMLSAFAACLRSAASLIVALATRVHSHRRHSR